MGDPPRGGSHPRPREAQEDRNQGDRNQGERTLLNSARYLVRANDGTSYGPAGLAELNAWIAEGRIGPDTLLSPEGSNALVAARTVAGLDFGDRAGPRSQTAPGPSPELRNAWLCAALAVLGPLVPCLGRAASVAALIGLFLSYRARKDREPNATAALVANAIGLAVSLAWTLLLIRNLG